MNQMSINMSLGTDLQLSLVKKNIEDLNPGDEILLTFTEDPTEILALIRESAGGGIRYEQLHRGPVEWNVLVKKKLSEGCCGCCGGE